MAGFWTVLVVLLLVLATSIGATNVLKLEVFMDLELSLADIGRPVIVVVLEFRFAS